MSGARRTRVVQRRDTESSRPASLERATSEADELRPVEIPDIDALDMALMVGIAAGIGTGAYGVALVAGAALIAEKAVRRSPEWPEQSARLLGAAQRPQLADDAPVIERSVPVAQQRQPDAAENDSELLRTLDTPPHLFFIGHTGGGKTTVMHEVAQRRVRRGDMVLVLDPDAAPGQWPGAKVFGGGDNFDAMLPALTWLDDQVEQRRKARAAGQRTFSPRICLILDEAQDTLKTVEGADPLVETIVRRGRKIGVNVIVGVQDDQVGTLGWEGRGHLMKNFHQVELFHNPTSGRRWARTQSMDGYRVELDVPQLTDPETLIVNNHVTVHVPAAATAQPVSSAAVTGKTVTEASTTAHTGDQELLAGLLGVSRFPHVSQSFPHGGVSQVFPERFPAVSEGQKGEIPVTAALETVSGETASGNINVVIADTAALETASPSLTLVLPESGEVEKYDRVRALVALGVSGRKIREIVGGKTQEIGDLVRRAREELTRIGWKIGDDVKDATKEEE
jgi:DNA-binding transcriptional regulator YdaS (Cro superfamily)